MLGAIMGDVIGSRYEFYNHRSKEFDLFHSVCTFTDDTVLTIATAKALLDNYPFKLNEEGINKIKKDLVAYYLDAVDKYPDAGYGGRFYNWIAFDDKHLPYNSFGNGSAMRVSSVGWLAKSLIECKLLAKVTAEVTHNHTEGIKGAEAVAVAIFMARQGKTKEEIKEYVYDNYYPELDYLSYDELVETYKFNETCQGSVPEAIYCFLISESYEDAIRTAVSIGGDTDTIACMAGAIAEAYYKDTDALNKEFLSHNYLPQEFIDEINRLNKTINKN